MNSELFNDLCQSLKEAGQIRKGLIEPSRVFKYSSTDVKQIREQLSVSQAELALMMGVSKRTIQNWEQGRREPVGPAKALLKVFEYDPSFVTKALNA